MLKVNHKDTRNDVVLVPLLLTLNIPYSRVSIVNFEHVITGWVFTKGLKNIFPIFTIHYRNHFK